MLFTGAAMGNRLISIFVRILVNCLAIKKNNGILAPITLLKLLLKRPLLFLKGCY